MQFPLRTSASYRTSTICRSSLSTIGSCQRQGARDARETSRRYRRQSEPEPSERTHFAKESMRRSGAAPTGERRTSEVASTSGRHRLACGGTLSDWSMRRAPTCRRAVAPTTIQLSAAVLALECRLLVSSPTKKPRSCAQRRHGRAQGHPANLCWMAAFGQYSANRRPSTREALQGLVWCEDNRDGLVEHTSANLGERGRTQPHSFLLEGAAHTTIAPISKDNVTN